MLCVPHAVYHSLHMRLAPAAAHRRTRAPCQAQGGDAFRAALGAARCRPCAHRPLQAPLQLCTACLVMGAECGVPTPHARVCGSMAWVYTRFAIQCPPIRTVHSGQRAAFQLLGVRRERAGHACPILTRRASRREVTARTTLVGAAASCDACPTARAKKA